ncbi:hypothetical protein NKJ93_30805 [Mesorhizobium sp. M0028]|uniref:hypothetical protein n=1 Tax=unclassified Mesorhizobium TaxID=325217 RepID=UPI00333DE96C
MNGLIKAAVIAGALATCYAYVVAMQQAKADAIKEGLQALLDDNIPGSTNFEVDYVEVPYTAVLPLVASPQYTGYFSIVRNENGKLTQCNAIVDYEYRGAGDKFHLQIQKAQVTALTACQ